MDFCMFFYLLDIMLMKALAIYMQEKVLSSCVVFQQRRKSSCSQENQWFPVSKLTLRAVLLLKAL